MRIRLWFLVLLATGCQADPVGSGTAPANLVRDFDAPALRGLVVRDHPKGAEVMYRFEAPWTTYEPCTVFTSVNGQAVRSATHFRDLVNATTTDPSTPAIDLGYVTPGGSCRREPPAAPTTATAETVSGFRDPVIAKLVVKNHPDGVEVVASGGTWHQPGTVFVAVDEVPIRNARHFREMLDDAYGRGRKSSLKYR
jgi:hypothetical protein